MISALSLNCRSTPRVAVAPTSGWICAEAREQHPAGEIDHPGRRTDEGIRARVIADIDDLLALHGDGLGPGPLGIDRIDPAMPEDDIGLSVCGFRRDVLGPSLPPPEDRRQRGGTECGTGLKDAAPGEAGASRFDDGSAGEGWRGDMEITRPATCKAHFCFQRMG